MAGMTDQARQRGVRRAGHLPRLIVTLGALAGGGGSALGIRGSRRRHRTGENRRE